MLGASLTWHTRLATLTSRLQVRQVVSLPNVKRSSKLKKNPSSKVKLKSIGPKKRSAAGKVTVATNWQSILNESEEVNEAVTSTKSQKNAGVRKNGVKSENIVEVKSEKPPPQRFILENRRRLPRSFENLIKDENQLLSFADKPRFSVMSWNIMSDAHLDASGLSSLKSLPRNRRSALVLDDIRSLNADVIALQEVERDLFRSLLEPQLGLDGYTGVHHERGQLSPFESKTWSTDRQDGCAFFWKQSVFELLRAERAELRQVIHERGNGKFGLSDAAFLRQFMYYSNIASLVLLRHRNSGHLLAVANLHLYSNQLRPSVQIAQAHMAMHRLSETVHVARTEHSIEPSVLLCGDLNAVPSSSLVQAYLIQGHVAAEDRSLEYNGVKFAQRDLYHRLGYLKNAYPEALGHQRQVDYIFGSADQLVPLAVLKRPRLEASGHILSGSASEQMPSDHAPIMCHYAIKDDSPRSAKKEVIQDPSPPVDRPRASHGTRSKRDGTQKTVQKKPWLRDEKKTRNKNTVIETEEF